MSGLVVVSLFDGIGGAIMAIKNLGIKIRKYYSSEIDEKCLKILSINHKEIIHLGDVKNISFLEDKIDLLIGGSPCQNLSCSGKREGLNGDQSKLFYEFIRIKEILNPTYFLFENVASMKQFDRDIITKLLEVSPILLNSSLLTAQNRNRYYWTNIPNQTIPKNLNITLKDIIKEENVKCVASRGRFSKTEQKNIQKLEPRCDGKTNTLTSVLKDNYISINDQLRSLTPEEYELLQGFPLNYTSSIPKTSRYKVLANSFTVPIISHLLSPLLTLYN